MSINGRTKAPPTAGFIISMVGLSDIPLGLVMMFLIDKYIEMEPVIAGISLGQWIAAIMILGGIGIFFYGRRLGWTHSADSGSPVRRG